MASKTIKGITVEISGDTTKLGKALADVNSKSKSLQSELYQVEKLLKLDPSNTELLAQKQAILAEQVKNSADKMKVLKETQEQIKKQFENGEIDEGQYRAFQRELAKTEIELNDVEDASDGAEKEVKELGDETEKTSNKMEILKGVASGVVTGIKAIATAGAGAVTAVAGLAVSAGASADDINTLSKTTGLATDTIQKFQYATDLIDVDMSTLTTALKKTTSAMSSAKDGSASYVAAFETLGVSITDTNGNLRDNEEVFYDCIEALGQVSNETERDALAMDIFGKSASELNPLIEGGVQQLQSLGEEAENAGLILSQEALDGANAFNDALDQMKATGSSAFKVLGSSIATDFTPYMQSANSMLLELATNLIQGYKEGGIDGLVGAVGDSLSSIISKITEYLPKVIEMGVSLLKSLIQGINDNLAMATNGASSIISTLIGGILDLLPDIITLGINLIVTLAKGIADSLPTLIPMAVDCVLTLVDTILDNLDLIIDAATELIIQLAVGLVNALPKLIEKLPTIIAKIVVALVKLAPELQTASLQLITQMAKGLVENIPVIVKQIPTIIKQVLKTFKDGFSSAADIGLNLVKGIWNGISNATSWILDKIKGFGSAVLNGIKKIFGIHSPSTLMRDEVGKYLAEGIGVGITDNADAPIDATSDLVDDITKQVNGVNLEANVNRTFSNAQEDVSTSGVATSSSATTNTPQALNITLKFKDLTLGKAVISDLKSLTKINGSNPILDI